MPIKEMEEAIKLFADLLVCGCILDDLYDASDDRLNIEPNIILELGGTYKELGTAKSIYDNLRIELPTI